MPRKRRKPKRKPLNRRIIEIGGKKYMEIKPGVDGKTFRTNDAFKGSRRASSEFAQAAIASKLIRQSIAHLLDPMPQKNMHNKLSKKIAKMIREEKASPEKPIPLNNISWTKLEGYELNEEVSMHMLIGGAYTPNIEPSTGKILIPITKFFINSRRLQTYKAAEYIRVLAAAATIDFDNKKTSSDQTASEYMLVHQPEIPDLTLTLSLPAPIIYPLFIALGAVCADKKGNTIIDLNNKRIKSLTIIRVHHQPIPLKPPTPKRPPRKSPKGRK